MKEFHRYIGYLVPAGFLILFLWSLVLFFRSREPGDRYWKLLAVLQAILGLQAVAGGILFLAGYQPPPQSNVWLHYVYGGLFPIGVLVFAHIQARKREALTLVLFGSAAFVNFGLTSRALMTGLGIGVD